MEDGYHCDVLVIGRARSVRAVDGASPSVGPGDMRRQHVLRRLSVAPYLPTNHFLKYYMDYKLFLSPEGILKISSFVACVCTSVVFVWGGGAARCARAGGVAAGAPLAAAALLTALIGALALHVPIKAPVLFFYTDITLSAVSGAALLVVGALALLSCELSAPLHYAHAVVSLCGSCAVVAGSAATYWAVTRLQADASPPARAPRNNHAVDV